MLNRILIQVMILISLPIVLAAQALNIPEMYGKRTLYSETYYLENGRYKTVISQQPLHYRTPQGFLKDIDLACKPYLEGYRNKTNTFESRFLSNGIQLIGTNNQTMAIQAITQRVSNTPMNGSPSYSPDEKTIKYTNEDIRLKYKLLPGRLHVSIKFLNSVDIKNSNLPMYFILNSRSGLEFKMLNTRNIAAQSRESQSIFNITTPIISGKNNTVTPAQFQLTKKDRNTFLLTFTLSSDLYEQNLGDGMRLEFNIESQYDPPFLAYPGIYKEYVNSSYSEIFQGFSGYVGNYPYNDTTEHRYRSGQYWDVSGISGNPVIDSIRFRIEITPVTTESFTISLKDVDHGLPGDLTTLYDDWGTGTTYESIEVEYYTDYHKTFTSGSSPSFVQDFKNSLSQGWFGIGLYTSSETTPDRYAWYDTDYGYIEVFYYNPSVPYKIAVNNDFGGGLYKVIFQGDTLQRTIPDTLTLFHGDQAGLMALNQDDGSSFRVFQYWFEQPGNNQYYENPLNITATKNVSYTWQTRRRFDITLDNDFIDGGSGGYIIVNDTNRTVPYFQYVFEDDPIEIEAPTQTQTVNGKQVTYNFLKWSDGNTSNPRTFTPTSHGQISAVMKGHLVSSSPTALTHNGGRKVWTNPGWNEEFEPGYQIVYEDNGDIYYTAYWRTIGQPYEYYWSNERLLSDGSGNSSNPSISTFSNDGYVACVVWQQYDPAIDKYIIKYWLDWQPPVALDTTTTATEPQPVVGAYFVNDWGGAEYSWHFVWNDGSGLKYAVVDDYGNTYIYDIDGTDANCHNPTITDNWYNANLGIAWDKNGDIYYQEVDLSSPGYNPIDSPVNLACSIAGSETPSISNQIWPGSIKMLTWSANYIFVSCNDEMKAGIQGSSLPDRVIVARRKDANGYWGVPRFFQYGSKNISPSVGYEYYQDKYFHVIWQAESQGVLAMLSYLEGVGWYEDEPQIFTGTGIKTPSMSSWSGPGISAVWAENSASPFNIVHQTITPTEAKLRQTVSTEVVREGIIHLSDISSDLKGTLIIELEMLQDISKNEIIPFALVSREEDVFMGSDYFSPAANAKLYKLKVNLRGIGVEVPALSNSPNWEIFRAELKSAPEENKLLGSDNIKGRDPSHLLKRFEWTDLKKIIKSKDFYFEKEYEVDLGEWIGTSVYIDMDILNSLPFEADYAEEIRLKDIPSENIEAGLISSKLKTEAQDPVEKISEYALHPAYPNPFNPSTTIAFDLPEPQQVQLEIFDISGKKVRTLVNRNMESGSHESIWDGCDDSGDQVASGVYFYRIQGGEFTAVNKMMLLR